jgi:hypothetical protein
MISCEEAAKLISQSLDRPLPVRQRIGLRLHLLMCRVCPRFLRQMRVLRKTATRYPEKVETDETRKLSEEAREKIRRKLTPP